MEEFYNAYLEALTADGKHRAAIRNFRNPTRKFIGFLKERDILEVNQLTDGVFDDFQTWLYADRGLSYWSVVAYMRDIRFFFDYLVDAGKLERNLLKNRRTIAQPEVPTRQQPHYYTYDEVETRYLAHQRKWVTFCYLNNERKHIKGFIKYLRSNEIKSFYTVTEKTLLNYREYLWEEFVHAREDGLVVRSQKERLCCVVRLFNYLEREGILKANPSRPVDWRQYYKEIYEKERELPAMPIENNDLTELVKYKNEFLQYELTKGKCHSTVQWYKNSVEVFYGYLEENGVSNLAQVNKRILLNYYYFLNNMKTIKGVPPTNSHKNKLIWTVKLLFRFLVRYDKLAKDPTFDLEPVKEESGLPRDFMNEKEVTRMLEQPVLSNDPLTVRDRAIMEVLFSTGMRSNELCSMNIEDVDFQQGMVRINAPKGGVQFQRIIPIGRIALEVLSKYLNDARQKIESDDPKALFLSYSGRRLQTEGVLNIVKKYAHECGFRKKITTHSFRVTCATEMLRNRADKRYVQEQLGHRSISSTQIYTRLAPMDLKNIHSKCHPREKN